MDQQLTVVFVCEHGAAKSILAAAYFNQLAQEAGSDVRAIARGTHPDAELSPQVIRGLTEDGLAPTEMTPQKLTQAELETARQVIAFCELPAVYHQPARIEFWEHIPAVSADYAGAREAILERVRRMLGQ